MPAVLFDLDGVIYRGKEAIAGARETLAWVRRRGLPHLFLTNTSSRSRRGLVERLEHMGIPATVEEILSPPVVAARWLATHAPGPAALFVPEKTKEEFAGLPQLPAEAETGAAAVVVGYLGPGWDFATLNRAFRLLMAEPHPPLVALGMTRYWHHPKGLTLDVGPFVRALEFAAGSEALVLGKPAPSFFRAALERLGCSAAETVMVGDDVRTDVGAAQALGLRGVLVRTGKFRPKDLQAEIRPDAVLASVADLPAWWESQAFSRQ